MRIKHHAGHSIAMCCGRLAHHGPLCRARSKQMGLQGTVGGTKRLYIVFVSCREGGKAAGGGRPNIAAVWTLLYRGDV